MSDETCGWSHGQSLKRCGRPAYRKVLGGYECESHARLSNLTGGQSVVMSNDTLHALGLGDLVDDETPVSDR